MDIQSFPHPSDTRTSDLKAAFPGTVDDGTSKTGSRVEWYCVVLCIQYSVVDIYLLINVLVHIDKRTGWCCSFMDAQSFLHSNETRTSGLKAAFPGTVDDGTPKTESCVEWYCVVLCIQDSVVYNEMSLSASDDARPSLP